MLGYRARLARVSWISRPAAMTCAAVGGAVEPYTFMSGRREADSMPGMPGNPDDPAPGAAAAMPAGPSGPAQPGTITVVVAATTKAGTAATLARAARPRRRTGRSARDGRHQSAAHQAIRANSRNTLTPSRPPNGSAWPASGPTGQPNA